MDKIMCSLMVKEAVKNKILFGVIYKTSYFYLVKKSSTVGFKPTLVTNGK